MSGDLLTDAQLAADLERVHQYVVCYDDERTLPPDNSDWQLAARIRDHLTALNRRIAALNARNALPCPKCGHQRVPE